MFYQEKSFDNKLRFGDIIKGFLHITPNFKVLKDNIDTDIKIEISKVDFFVVLTPCCSIENKNISLAPLKSVIYTFFNNEHFKEDLTIINKMIPPQKSVSRDVWENRFSEEERQKRISEGPKFAFIENFIFDQNLLLPEYTLEIRTAPKIITGYYMIDFKDIFTLKSDTVQRGMNYPKILELSVETRNELRLKISEFFTRVPEEDKILLYA